MSFADASQTRLSQIAEATLGLTPASPAFQNVRMTSESLNADISTLVSNEIRPDRNIPDLIRVGSGASGGFAFELSYGSFDSILESALFSSWVADEIRNGTVRKSFSFEKTFEQGAVDSYLRYRGMVVNTFTLNCEAQQIVTGSFDFMGMGASVASVPLSGSNYTPASITPVLSASSDFSALDAGDSPTPSILSVNLNVTNNLRAQPVIGQIDLIGIGAGRFEVTGTLRAYFEDIGLYNRYVEGLESSLAFTVGQTTGQKYQFRCPRIKFENGTIVAGGNDEDVIADMTFRALYAQTESPNEPASLVITRAVA